MTESAIKRVRVSVGTDHLGYYTTLYANGEPGSRSEGYGRPPNEQELADEILLAGRERANKNQAVAAAVRDYPEVEMVGIENP